MLYVPAGALGMANAGSEHIIVLDADPPTKYLGSPAWREDDCLVFPSLQSHTSYGAVGLYVVKL